MKNVLKIIGLLIGITNLLFAISFAKTFGTGSWDYGRSIQQTSDGGYIVAGKAYSLGAGYFDFLVIKLYSNGNIQWARALGGSNLDSAYSIRQTIDGGYVVAGITNSFGAGNWDILVIKLYSNGDVQWAKTFGESGNEYAYSIRETSDGGCIVVGNLGNNILVIKLNSNGDIQWAKTFGANGSGYSVQQTSDGGYIVAGTTNSFGAGSGDFLVIKLYSDGNIEWARTLGGSSVEYAYSIQQTSDGGYIVAGTTNSLGAGPWDVLVIKLYSDGNMEWARTLGGPSFDYAYSIQQTSDGGYIVAGYTASFGAGASDFLVIKTQDGNMAPDCPWYACNPTVTSPSVSTSSPSLTVTSPTLTITSPSISVSSPTFLLTYNICSQLGEYDDRPKNQEDIYFPENIKLFSSTFFKDRISLIFSGYSNEKIKIVLYDVLGNEIISKSFDFNNYIEIKDKRIEKIKKGIYFLKIYLKGKGIGSLKVIK